MNCFSLQFILFDLNLQRLLLIHRDHIPGQLPDLLNQFVALLLIAIFLGFFVNIDRPTGTG